MAKEEVGRSRSASGSRRTRSQAAPDWSPTDELILVNEIAAVEADCLKALSSYQKWKIIAENCAAQDVSRSLNQYKRKWDSLLQEYNAIKKWDSRSRRDSYWSLKADKREELGLPRSFDDELFAAIGNLVRARENQSDTEPESDGEAKDDMVDADKELVLEIALFVNPRYPRSRPTQADLPEKGADTCIHKHTKGSKRKRRQFTSQEKRAWKNLVEEDASEHLAKEEPSKSRTRGKPPRSHVEKNPLRSMEEKSLRNPEPDEEKPQQRNTKKMPPRSHVEKNPLQGSMEEKSMRNPEPDEEKPQQRNTKKMPRKGHVEEKETINIEGREKVNEESPERKPALEEKPQRPQTGNVDHVKEKETVSIEDKKQMIASILLENAARISSIVAEDTEYEAENAVSADQDGQTKSVEFVRKQGDKLIACLGNIVKTLNQLSNLVPRM